METYLLSWNPAESPHDFSAAHLTRFHSTGRLPYRWRTIRTRNFPVGSRVFVVRAGVDPKGVVASGWTTREPYMMRGTVFVGLQFDQASREPLIPLAALERDRQLRNFDWLVEGSGVPSPGTSLCVWRLSRRPSQVRRSTGRGGGLAGSQISGGRSSSCYCKRIRARPRRPGGLHQAPWDPLRRLWVRREDRVRPRSRRSHSCAPRSRALNRRAAVSHRPNKGSRATLSQLPCRSPFAAPGADSREDHEHGSQARNHALAPPAPDSSLSAAAHRETLGALVDGGSHDS